MKKRLSVTFALIMLLTLLAIPCYAEENPLSGKSALFCGDSITAGWRDEAMNGSTYGSGNGWAKRIGTANNMTVKNAGVAGASLTNVRPNRILAQINGNSYGNYDYVILHGGFNDAMGDNTLRTKESAAPIGAMSSSFAVADFKTNTFAGALEELFYVAKQAFPKAKIGFIINYSTPRSQYGGYTADSAHMKEQWDVAKAICNKWGVAYLDLFEGTASNGQSYSNQILKTNTGTYFPGSGDDIHLNSRGYDTISPYIAEWMKTMDKPSSENVTIPTVPNSYDDDTSFYSTTTKKTTADTTTAGNDQVTKSGDNSSKDKESEQIKEKVTTTLPQKKGVVVNTDYDFAYYETSAGSSLNVTLIVVICAVAVALVAAGIVVALLYVKKKK